MTIINVNESIDTIEMYKWGQEDDWTEFGDYDCPDLPKQYYKGPHRLDALLNMSKKERMALVCTAIADQVISDWGTVPWTNYYGPDKFGWLHMLATLSWEIQNGELTLEDHSETTKGLISELGFDRLSILDRPLFPPDEKEIKAMYAEVIYGHLFINYPSLMNEKDEKWWLYHFKKDDLPYVKRV